MGLKLPYSLISTAPKEFQEQPITGKLSKNQKKKMKKKAKRQTELIKKQLEHIQQLDAMPDKVVVVEDNNKGDDSPKNGTADVDQQNNDDGDADDNTPDGPPSNEMSQSGNEIVNGTQKSEVNYFRMVRQYYNRSDMIQCYRALYVVCEIIEAKNPISVTSIVTRCLLKTLFVCAPHTCIDVENSTNNFCLGWNVQPVLLRLFSVSIFNIEKQIFLPHNYRPKG